MLHAPRAGRRRCRWCRSGRRGRRAPAVAPRAHRGDVGGLAVEQASQSSIAVARLCPTRSGSMPMTIRQRIGARPRGSSVAASLAVETIAATAPLFSRMWRWSALGVGDVGRHGDRARRHDREVGDAPFGAVLADQHDAVAAPDAERAQRRGHPATARRRRAPRRSTASAAGLVPQERVVAVAVGLVEEIQRRGWSRRRRASASAWLR